MHDQGLFQDGPEGRSARATEFRGATNGVKSFDWKSTPSTFFFFFLVVKIFFRFFLYKGQQIFFSARATRGLKEPLNVTTLYNFSHNYNYRQECISWHFIEYFHKFLECSSQLLQHNQQ